MQISNRQIHPTSEKANSAIFVFRSRIHVVLGLAGRKLSALRCRVGDHNMSGAAKIYDYLDSISPDYS
jgi:hypothetical protein